MKGIFSNQTKPNVRKHLGHNLPIDNMTNRFIALLIIVFSFGYILKEKLQLGPIPKELPSIDTSITKLTWPIIVEEHHKYFANDYAYSGDSSIAARELNRNMFGSVYGWTNIFHKEIYNSIVIKFYNSPKAWWALYKWSKPMYIETFKKLPDWKKSVYRRMLTHAKKYTAEFNYNAELKVYRKNPEKFLFDGINGKRGDFKNMETFIFRRIYNRQMTLQQVRQWIDILQKDLKGIK